MIRLPAVAKGAPAPQTISRSIPASVGGLNAIASLADMPEQDATVLINIFPRETDCLVRDGYEVHHDGLTGSSRVETLMPYAGATTNKLFAATGTSVHDVTSVGSGGAAVVTGLTNARWIYTNYATTSGYYLYMVNGADDPRHFDGTNWATPALTGSGLTPANLSWVTPHKERLWFIEKNTMNAWYLDVRAIAGTLTKFPLGAVFKQGGTLKAIGTLSVDSGLGPDDYIAFLSTKGEVVLYAGINPASADDWALVGVYRTGTPVGTRPVEQVGGDLLITTNDGVVSTKGLIKSDRGKSQYFTLTSKINPLLNSAARAYGTNFGWQLCLYPLGKWLIVNVPVSTGIEQIQYVMNTTTGAWCVFSEMNANCWAVHNDELYFGGNMGDVYKADTGYNDNGNDIVAVGRGAFNYLGLRGILKKFNMIRPLFGSSGAPEYRVALDVDFGNVEISDTIPIVPEDGAIWDTDVWDTGVWGGATNVLKRWQTVKGIGMAAAVRYKIRKNGQSVNVFSFDILAERGGIL